MTEENINLLEKRLEKYRRRFRTVLVILIVFLILAGMYIYTSYDYLAFKFFMTQFYSYSDTLDDVYGKDLSVKSKGSYYGYFDDLAISAVTQRIRTSNNDRYTYLYTPDSFRKYKEDEKTEAQKSELKVLNDRTAYVRITNFSTHTDKFLNDAAGQIRSYPDLIIDLRDNYGGDTDAMNDMAGLFLSKGSVISTDALRMLKWTYKAKGGTKLTPSKVIILQNSNTASASEGFITALKDNLPNVTLIGTTTFGKGIGQFTLPLRNGFAVKATILQWYTPKGENIHRKGIEPDIQYTNEDIVQFALQKISG